MLEKKSVKVIKTKEAIYNDSGELLRSAEYAVVSGAELHPLTSAQGKQIRARIIRNGKAWYCIDQTAGRESFGRPVSPVDIRKLTSVRKWAINYYAQR